MKYHKSLIQMTDSLESSKDMYSLICLKATGLSMVLNKVQCYLDGQYLLCLSIEDELSVKYGEYEAQTLHFLPYFYNVNLNHNVIGLPMYEEMRTLYGYPDFHLFRVRDERFFGILRLHLEEYEMAQVCFQRAKQHIDDHENDINWSCRTRSDMISILRIAEGAYIGEQSRKGNNILRYIRENLGNEITLASLCKHFHTNRTTLTRLINELTGMSPMQYVLEERLNQSRPDLLFTWFSIGEIAEKYGFEDANYYIRAFKKRFGTTPLQYRHRGCEERIRNQNIYHEKEKSMINIKDFETYVQKGLGRAITLLKDQKEKAPYRKPLIDCIVQKGLGRALGEYEKDLIDCFDDRDEIAQEIAEIILEQLERNETLGTKIPLLVLLGYKNEVTKVVEKHYSNSYAELLEFTKCGDSEEKYPICSRNYFSAAADLARCKVDAERIKQIISDMADLYQYSDHPVVPEYQNPIFTMMSAYGKDAITKLIDEVVAVHPHGSKLDKHSLRTNTNLPDHIEPITAKDISDSDGFDENYPRLFNSFRVADEAVLREVAEQVSMEKDPKRQQYLLSFFTRGISPDLLPPAFPLDPTPLIEKFEELNPTLYKEIKSSFSKESLMYLETLTFTRHPSVKAFGKRIMDQYPDYYSARNQERNVYNCALRLYYGANYCSEDRGSFVEILLSEPLLSEPPFIIDSIAFRIFVDMIKLKTPELPLDMIPYVYNNVDRYLRYELVKALVEIDALPEDIKNECRWDCFKKTRDLVR